MVVCPIVQELITLQLAGLHYNPIPLVEIILPWDMVRFKQMLLENAILL